MPAEKKVPQRIRELMPDGYTRILTARTGCYQHQTMSDVVLSENPRAKYWPAALALAEETDPAGFALWAEANPDKLPTTRLAA
jgi:hypothetical protein